MTTDRRGQTLALSLVAVAVLCSQAAGAEKVPAGPVTGAPNTPGLCETSGYKSFTNDVDVPIPDGTPAGVDIGPINVADDGQVFSDVIISLDITHTWVGDLIARVSYDIECDDNPDIGPVTVICRPGVPACPVVSQQFGCDDDLDGVFVFSDAATAELGAGCPAGQPPGCYALPATGPDASASGALSDFDGAPKGGCFTVNVSDNANLDTGTVRAVTVWTENFTPVVTASWGRIKARY